MHSLDYFFLLFLSDCSCYSSFWLFHFILFLLLLFDGVKLIFELFIINFFLLLLLLIQKIFLHLLFELRVNYYLIDSFFVICHFTRVSHCVHPSFPIPINTLELSNCLFLGCKLLEEFSILLI